MPYSESEIAKMKTRLLETVDLMDFGIALMRQNITRRNPDATEEEINEKLNAWLLEQPGVVKKTTDQKESL